jgi:hypothetical protein
MPSHPRSLCAALVAAAVAAAPIVVAPAAQALPVFTVSELTMSADVTNVSEVLCSADYTSSQPPSPLPVVENGASTSATVSARGTVTRNSDPTEVVTVASTITGAGTVTSVGPNPATLDLAATGSVEASTTKPTSACEAVGEVDLRLGYTFTVAQGGFLTMSTTTSARTAVSAYVADLDHGAEWVELGGQGPKFDGTMTVYLPPGEYWGTLVVSALVSTRVAVPTTPVRGSVHAEFAVAGSQTAASVGKGAKYVALPSARSCATHALTASVVGKRKLAKKVKQVRVFVNDVQVAKVRTPKRGALLTVPVADGVRADVRSEITLRSKRKGRPGKVLETSAAYEACS